jgi:hypothetical protein
VKRVLILIVAAFLVSTAYAQSDDMEVVLPEQAQSCVLPSAPDAIAEDADYDRLVAAKGDVANFQTMLLTYRDCLQDAEDDKDLTEGNRQAMTASYNFSVDMEERVAERFNAAVRSYKERNPSN